MMNANPTTAATSQIPDKDISREERWRLVLGSEADEALGSLGAGGKDNQLSNMDSALEALYEPDGKNGLSRRGGRGKSSPSVSRWLGDIRKYFPSQVVKVMQHDALDRLNLRELLLEPEMLEAVEADVHLIADLMSLSGVIPENTKQTARLVVQKVVDELMKKLEEPMRSAVTGALNRAVRNNRPRHSEIDWNRTIKANLKHWQQDLRTIIPEQLIGYGRKAKKPQREVMLCIDQSGSMGESIVYSAIFGAVMASLPTVATRMVVFDTEIVDLSEKLEDPVELLFGVQMGGGTDIHRAMTYCQQLIREPHNTIMVLISDLEEGGIDTKLLSRAKELVESGVQLITLLALSDDGRASYNVELAAKLATLGVPSFACTPDAFPSLMAAAIRREDVAQWAANEGLVTTGKQRA